jgi:hypothetical protein
MNTVSDTRSERDIGFRRTSASRSFVGMVFGSRRAERLAVEVSSLNGSRVSEKTSEAAVEEDSPITAARSGYSTLGLVRFKTTAVGGIETSKPVLSTTVA